VPRERESGVLGEHLRSRGKGGVAIRLVDAWNGAEQQRRSAHQPQATTIQLFIHHHRLILFIA
jgi:hypothetical protein